MKKDTRFSKDNQPLRRRGKGILKILEDTIGSEYKLDLSANDILDVYHFLSEKTEFDLRKLLNNQDVPIFIKIISNKLLNKKFDWIILEKITDKALKREGLRSNQDNKLEIRYDFEDISHVGIRKKSLTTREVSDDMSSLF